MAVRRTDWRKYVRVGGFLLVFALFAPVLGIFLVQTLSLIPKRIYVSTPSPNYHDQVMEYKGGVMMDQPSVAAADIDGDTLWGGQRDIAPIAMDAVTVPSWGMTTPVSSFDQKMVKSASLELRAQSLVWTSDQIQASAKNAGGYVESANVSQPKNDVQTAWLVIRVPVDRLEVVIEEVKKVASSVISENLNVGDVTDQSIDLVARLNAKRAEETALVSLLDKSNKVSDVIEVTDRLALVRSEIEGLDAQQRRLEGQVAMSSISISITEDPRVVIDGDAVRDGNVIKQSVNDLARWGLALGSALAAIVISGVPVLVVYGFFMWVFYRLGVFVAKRVTGRK